MDPTSNITISNVFIDESMICVDTTGTAGQIIGEVKIDSNITNKLLIQYSRVNTINNESDVNATNVLGKKSYNSKYVTLKDNITLNETEKYKKENFNNYDFDNIWGYDNEVYLRLFYDEIVDNPIPEVNVSFDKYLLNDNYIYNILPLTTRNDFVSNMIINSELNYKIYNISGKILSGDDFIGTGSYIIISNGIKTKTYDISVYGDVSGDGKASIKDVYMIADYVISNDGTKGSILSSVSQIVAADVNKDDRISISDVFKVADYAIDPSKGF